MSDFKEVNERLKTIKVVEVQEDKSYGGNKVYVTLEAPLKEGDGRLNDWDQFFRMDQVKQLAIKESAKVLHKETGWSDISRLFFFKDGQPVTMHEPADAVRVKYTCLSAP